MTVLDIRQRRGDLVAIMRHIVTASDGRATTAEESRAWDAANREFDQLSDQLAIRDPEHPPDRRHVGDRAGLEAVEAELGQSMGTRAARRQDDVPAGPVAESRILGPRDSVRSFLAAQQRVDADLAGLRIGALMKAMVTGAKTPSERRALAEGSDSTGGVTVPDITSADLIDKLRARLVLARLGARVVPLTTDKTTIARLDTDPIAAWRLENAPVAESDPTFSGVVFQPKTLAVIVKASRELVEDSLNIVEALENAFTRSMAVELERVALAGSGTAPEPRGIRNTTGVHESTASLTNYDALIDLAALVWGANAVVNGMAMAPRSYATIGKWKNTLNDPLTVPPVLVGIPLEQTTAVSITEGTAPADKSTLYLGDWTQLLLGIRLQVRIELLRERYVDSLQYGWVAYMRADTALAHPAAFGRLISIPAAPAVMLAEEPAKARK
jgi:HK97 family phage major capsid protein